MLLQKLSDNSTDMTVNSWKQIEIKHQENVCNQWAVEL